MLQLLGQLFLYTSIAALIFLLAGLYKPWMMLWWEDIQNRRKVIKLYGTVATLTYVAHWITNFFMNRLFFKTLFVFLIFSFLSCSSKKSDDNKLSDGETVANELPAMDITFLNGEKQSARNLTGKVILIFFQPDCDHCQREAQQIEQNLEAFKDYSLFFISSNPIDQIEKFSVDYALNNKPNVSFAWTTTESVINNFGSIAAPSVYIYSSERKLVRSFNGEVAIDVLLKSI